MMIVYVVLQTFWLFFYAYYYELLLLYNCIKTFSNLALMSLPPQNPQVCIAGRKVRKLQYRHITVNENDFNYINYYN